MYDIKRVDVAELAKQNEVTKASCYIYVVSEAGTNYYKIGIAGHPTRRLSTLQCGNNRRLELFAVYEGSRGDCARIEGAALRFFDAPKGSEWVYVDHSHELEKFFSAFEVVE